MKTPLCRLGTILGFIVCSTAHAADKTWTGSVNNDWYEAGNWSPPGVPAGSATIQISSNSPNATPPVTITGTLNWSAGTIDGALTVASNGVMNLSGSAEKYLFGTLTNSGTVNWMNTGNLLVFNNDGGPYNGSIHNLAGGLFNIQNDQSIVCACYGYEYFNNAGTVRKSAGTGTTTVSVTFTNTGTVEADMGTIRFDNGGRLGGQFTTAGGAVRFASGEFVLDGPPGFSGDVRFTGGDIRYTVPITNFELSGGTLVGTNLVTGTLNWTAGYVRGALTVASSGVMTLRGSAEKYLFGALTNSGTVNWTNTGNLLVFNNDGGPYNGSINNLAGGLFNIQNDQSIACACYGYEYFNNAGTVRKGAGTGTTTVSVTFTNTGTVEADMGTISFDNGGRLGGQFRTTSGAVRFARGEFVLNGPPGFSGDVRFTGGNIRYTVPITNFELGGGTLVGTNLVTGTLNWTAGSICGVLSVASNGMLNLGGSAEKYLCGALTNSGTVNWTNAGNFIVYNSGEGPDKGSINNLAGGLFNIQNDQSLFAVYGSEYFNNAGTVRKSGGPGTTTVIITFTNTGTVEVDMGTISFNNGGSLGGQFTTAGGAVRFASGEFVLNGPPSFSGDMRFTGGDIRYTVPITNFELSGGTLVGTNLVTGTLNWTAGYIRGALTVASNGVMNLSGSAEKYLFGALTNSGTVNWTNTGNIIVYNSGGGPDNGSIDNQAGARFNIQNDQSIVCACYGFEYFNNGGMVRKSPGAGITSLNLPFTNTGTVEADTGTIEFQAAYTETSAANLAFSLGGLTPGSSYGHINFSSPLTMNATFTVSTRNGFRPNPGDTFDVLSYPSATNDFTCFSGFDLGGGLWVQPQWRQTGLSLTATTYATNGLPSLSVARSPGGVRVFWTLGFPDFELVSSTNLFGFPPVWTPVPATNCDNQVVLPVTTRKQYFRLRKSN